MDSYDVHVHPIQFQLYNKESFWTFNIIKNRALPKIGKIWFFWRKIVIFHTKYPKNFRASLRSAQFF
jgi:predicted transglutaminase-like protease